MSRKTKKKKQDIFERRNVRDVTPGKKGEFTQRSLKGVNPLHAGASILMITTGFFAVFLGMLEYIPDAVFSSVLSLLGSITVMVGVWQLFETIRERKNIDNLVKGAVIRVIREKN